MYCSPAVGSEDTGHTGKRQKRQKQDRIKAEKAHLSKACVLFARWRGKDREKTGVDRENKIKTERDKVKTKKNSPPQGVCTARPLAGKKTEKDRQDRVKTE